MCRNITKTIKNISRTHCNFLGIFARNLACTGVQISQSEVCIANKNQENLKKLKAHGFTAQTHGSDGSGSS